MKRLGCFVFVLLLSISTVQAQSGRSTIRFSLSDGNLIRVALNGRYFNKTARRLTVNDIRGKQQEIKVYRFRPYANRRGGKATLAFSGRIKIEKGTTYNAVIDGKTGKLYLTPVDILPKEQGKLPDPAMNQPLNTQQEQTPDPEQQPTLGKENVQLGPDLQKLKTEIDKKVIDGEKLKKALSYLNTISAISSEAVYQITSWLLFDDTKLKFVQAAYPKVSNPESLEDVKALFTEDSSKRKLSDFLKKQ